jgi:uncharacterized delta-60 repeat protein
MKPKFLRGAVASLCFVRFLHAAPGDLDPTFDSRPVVNGEIRTLAVQPDDKVLIGGNFTYVRGIPRKSVARLNVDGSIDLSFKPYPGTNWFSSLAILPDGKILVAGGTARTNVVKRLNSDGEVDETFSLQVPAMDGSTWGLGLQADGKLFLAGNFLIYPQAEVPMDAWFEWKGVLRINANGTWDKTFSLKWIGGGPAPPQIVLQSDGKLLIDLRRFNKDGTPDTTFSVGSLRSSFPLALAVQSDGKVLVGGSLVNDERPFISQIVRLNDDGSLDPSFEAGEFKTSGVDTIVLQPDRKILIGGPFTAIDGKARNGIARLNQDGSLDLQFNPATPPATVVTAMALSIHKKVLLVTSPNFFDFTRDSVVRLLGDENVSPTCEIVRPSASQIFKDDNARTITIEARALDTDDSIASVEAFADGQSLGKLPGPTAANPLVEWKWNNPSIGKHKIVASATDSDGAQTLSDSVEILVLRTATPIPAVLTLDKLTPTNIFTVPASIDIPLKITALDPNGDPHHIEFFANGQLIGASDCQPCDSIRIQVFKWQNSPVGEYSIVAKGKDSLGTTLESNTLFVTVNPPINQLPVLSIVADPPSTSEPTSGVPVTPGKFIVSRTGPIDSSLTVLFKYGGNVNYQFDIDPIPEAVTFEAGQRSVEIKVWAKADTLLESTERVVLTILPSDSLSYKVDPNHASATVSIHDVPAEQMTVVSIEADVPETSESSHLPGVPPGSFTITRSSGSESEPQFVSISVTGTATPDLDYPAIPNIVAFAPGETQIVIFVEPINDNLIEETESVIVTVAPRPFPTPPYSVDPLKNTAQVLIHDNDSRSPGTIQIEHQTDGSLEFTVNAASGGFVILQSSSNLLDWIDLDLISISEPQTKLQKQISAEAARFYRVHGP